MKRWYDDEAEAREVARGSGYFLWHVQKFVKVQRGFKWSNERRASGPARYYVWGELPFHLRTSRYETKELEK